MSKRKDWPRGSEVIQTTGSFLIYASSERNLIYVDLAGTAIIKIDPLDQLLICNATSKIHKAYVISFTENIQ